MTGSPRLVPSARLPVWSTLLLIGVCAMWVRSRSQADVAAFFTRAGSLQALVSYRDSVCLLLSDVRFPMHRRLTFDFDHTPVDAMDELADFAHAKTGGSHRLLGFQFTRGSMAWNSPSSPFYLLRIPYWFLGLMTQIPPVRRWWRLTRRGRRLKQGRCADCGYDLRATGGRCPECGSIALI